MTKHFVAYGFTLLALVIIDAIWLRLVMLPLYQQHLRHLLADNPVIWPVIAFYIFYPAGIGFFVVAPALGQPTSLFTVLGSGLFLGLLAYSAYDLTNLATLKNWPVGVALLDLVWGGIVTAMSAAISVYCTKLILNLPR